jgi:hypothetical protein
MSFTNRSDPKQNPWYPRHVSDRAEELIEELDTTQCRQLYDELQKQTIGEWFVWLEEQREAISQYDALTRTQRKRRLGKLTDTSILKFHHACIFVELWRARMTSSYFLLPLSGGSLDAAEDQRRMMLAVLASHNDSLAIQDLWPFDVHEEAHPVPFRDSYG